MSLESCQEVVEKPSNKVAFAGLAKIFPRRNEFFVSVFKTLLTCLFAGTPTSLVPSSVNATVEGVVLSPTNISNTILKYAGKKSVSCLAAVLTTESDCTGMESYLPSAFSMTLAAVPSMTATQEFVVPRSMPMILQTVSISVWKIEENRSLWLVKVGGFLVKITYDEKARPWWRKVLTVFYFFKSELNILLDLFFPVQ